MAFGVFIHRGDSIYDDRPAESYQFPPQYLGRASACIGDWIIYYEPTKVRGRRGYFAVAKVDQIEADSSTSGMYRALIAPNSYLDFANPVPFAGPEGVLERGLLNSEGRISGRAQAAVRRLEAEDFYRIIARGLADETSLLPRQDALQAGFAEGQTPFVAEEIRERTTYLTSRLLRDRVFRQVVLRAYDSRCAITGLKLINGGGRAEVAAAHIRPVAKNGPDIVSNGLALSGTVHWMFDRGLIALGDDHQILLSRHINDAESVRGMINKTGRALLPSRSFEYPHPAYLRWHRECCFKN